MKVWLSKWGLETGRVLHLCGEIQATNRLINKGSLLSNEVEQTLQLLETLKLIKKCQYMQILNCFESIQEHGR